MSHIQLWKDLSPEGKPLQPPSTNAAHILVVGGGVIGLTTAWLLLDKGHRVTIVSKEWASFANKQRLTSQIAGALWEFPPAVCGHHTDTISLVNSKQWCMVAYHVWDAISAVPSLSATAGIRMKPAAFFFRRPVSECPVLVRKVQEIIASGVRGFRHTPDLIRQYNIHSAYGAVDAFELLSPVIDTDVCMGWLTNLVQQKGATLHTETITGDLFLQESHLRHRFNADAIVNATGLGSFDLADDKTCYPIRGALIRLVNDGASFPKIDTAMAVPAGENENSSSSSSSSSPNEIVFLVPRNDNTLLIGGIAEPHEWKLDLTLESPVVQRMRARCESFLPMLKNARLDHEYPLAQGLRPFRGKNVRVERELRTHGENPSRIVHNYGHGGAGWSLSFGCAVDILRLLEDALSDLAPVAMQAMVLGGNNSAEKL